MGPLARRLATLALGIAGCAPAGLDGRDCVGDACIGPTTCMPGRASAQFLRQTAPPSMLAPWARADVSLSFANCSGQTWTPAGFALRPARDPAGGVERPVWGAARVALPREVPDGYEVTVPFTISAPAGTGSYVFSYAVAHEGIEVFQEPSPPVAVLVAAPADCTAKGPVARFRSQVPPGDFVATGAAVHASVSFANCGTGAWSAKDGVTLASRTDPPELWGQGAVALPFEVPPGMEVAIPFELRAPSKPGRYDFAWQLRRGQDWIDQPAPTATSVVLDGVDCSAAGPPARFLSQRAPGDLARGQTVDVSARFGNCSGLIWDGAYRFDSALPGMDHLWGAGPIPLPLPIGSGYAVEIAFQVHAPGAAGTYPYRFGIVAGADGPLDEPTPLLDVHVRCVPACGDHNCGDDGCGGSCGGCAQNWSCDGAHCQPPDLPQCGLVQWWNKPVTYYHLDYGWNDNDMAGVGPDTPIQLRHDSHLDKTGVYGWGYMPEFTDLATGARFRILHLRPQHQNATNVGQVYPAGFVVGLSGGDTFDTGLPKYSTGAHLCVQTLVDYRAAFPVGQDPCR